MEMIFSDPIQSALPDKTPSNPVERLTCLRINSGKANCVVHFYPALYQLTLVKDDREEKLDLGFSGSRLLERLLQTPGEVVSREELMTYAWSDRVVGQGSLNQQIYTLRQILGDEKEREIIQTLPRRGYMLSTQYLELSTSKTPLDSQSRATTATAANEPGIAATVPAAQAVTPVSAPKSETTATTPRLPSGVSATINSIWKTIARNPIALVTGACALTLITTLMARENQGVNTGFTASATAKKGVTLTYAPEDAAQMRQLTAVGEKIVQQLENEIDAPLQLMLGAHDKLITLMCLRADGSARSLHFQARDIASLGKADLAVCL